MNGNNRRTIASTKSAAFVALSLSSILAVSISQGAAKDLQQPELRKPVRTTQVQATTPPPVRYLPAPPVVSSPERALAARIQSLGRAFNGDVGIAVKDIQTGFTTAYDGNTYFPQQSVSKFWVALTALDRADKGMVNLNAPVTVHKKDLTLFHQPIAAQVGPNGYNTTLSSLMYRALTQSDNTCNDFVLWKVGGPDAVRRTLAEKGISGIRFGPGERVMQARIAGMEWQPSYVGANFYAARNALPMNVRRAAFESYIRDPVDGATPVGTVEALARLKNGELLSPQSTQKLLDIMSNTKTGPQRLKGGLAPGWRLAHKTGTGQVLGSTQAGYNDIGIITGPDGRSYAIAVLIRRSSAPLQERMQTMQNTVRAVIDYSRAVPATRVAQRRPAPVQQATQPAAQPNGATMSTIAATVQSLSEEAE